MFDFLDLNLVGFLLVGILFTGYAILDGFDLGVGALHLLVRDDTERRTLLNAIGPVWDGNEVWLVTGGGALFAAFPDVYATTFSAFYVPFMLLLFSLILRAVSIEFRSKEKWPWWRNTWDTLFAVGSVASSLLIGVALGNVAMGIPLGPDMEYAGGFFNLLNPYALLVGVTVLFLFAMHAALYLVLKTEGELQQKLKHWSYNATALFIIGYISTSMATLLYVPQMADRVRQNPAFFLIALVAMLVIANIPRELYKDRYNRAFLSSCVNIVLLLGIFGLEMFPTIIRSTPNPEYTLTAYNAASSQTTLGIMLLIAILAVPMVLAYTASIYWVFRGKVKLDSTSY